MALGAQIDLLYLFGQFGREQKLSLRDPKAAELFIASVRADVKKALDNDALIHGQRTQNMFEALVVSCGDYKMMKMEDAGRIHPGGHYIAPDFRLVLMDGRQWLIEVKNVYGEDPRRQRLSLRKSDVAKLEAYSQANACPLKFAIYWARWQLWTLVDISDLEPRGNKLTIEMAAALRISEMGEIGDRTIGTAPPLTLRIRADLTKERSLAADGTVTYTIADASFFCAGEEIREKSVADLAWIFMLYGEWPVSDPRPSMSGGLLDYVEFEFAPAKRLNGRENFEIICRLSSMFSRWYAAQTLGPDGIHQTEADLRPGWFDPLINLRKSEALPIWSFILKRTVAT